jgi:hypothetical protein
MTAENGMSARTAATIFPVSPDTISGDPGIIGKLDREAVKIRGGGGNRLLTLDGERPLPEGFAGEGQARALPGPAEASQKV